MAVTASNNGGHDLSHGHEHGGARHEHAHSHAHGRASRSRRRLSIVLVLTAIYMVAEAVGGWVTGSLALLADAGHMLTDVAALALALIAVWFGSRPATPSKTFGYYRLEILAALINGVALDTHLAPHLLRSLPALGRAPGGQRAA